MWSKYVHNNTSTSSTEITQGERKLEGFREQTSTRGCKQIINTYTYTYRQIKYYRSVGILNDRMFIFVSSPPLFVRSFVRLGLIINFFSYARMLFSPIFLSVYLFFHFLHICTTDNNHNIKNNIDIDIISTYSIWIRTRYSIRRMILNLLVPGFLRFGFSDTVVCTLVSLGNKRNKDSGNNNKIDNNIVFGGVLFSISKETPPVLSIHIQYTPEINYQYIIM